jgi:hypothetical protein
MVRLHRRPVGENSLVIKDIPIRYKNKCEEENKFFCENESQLSRACFIVRAVDKNGTEKSSI